MGMVSAALCFCVFVVLPANCNILWARVLQKVIAQPDADLRDFLFLFFGQGGGDIRPQTSFLVSKSGIGSPSRQVQICAQNSDLQNATNPIQHVIAVIK